MQAKWIVLVVPVALVVGCGSSSGQLRSTATVAPTPAGVDAQTLSALKTYCKSDAVSRAGFFDELKKNPNYATDVAAFKKICPGVVIQTGTQALESALASATVGP